MRARARRQRPRPTHPILCALDDFDGRVPDDEVEEWLAARPHPDAVFDALWWSRHDPEDSTTPQSTIPKAWRFTYACVAGCPDAVGSMPATCDADGHPQECPDCGGPVARLARCWDVPIGPRPGDPWEED